MSRSLHSSSTRRLFGLLSLRRPEQWQEVSQAAIARCVDQSCAFVKDQDMPGPGERALCIHANADARAWCQNCWCSRHQSRQYMAWMKSLTRYIPMLVSTMGRSSLAFRFWIKQP